MHVLRRLRGSGTRQFRCRRRTSCRCRRRLRDRRRVTPGSPRGGGRPRRPPPPGTRASEPPPPSPPPPLAAGGDTIAILANGVDRPYPVGHRVLLDRVADVGLLASEVPPGAVPTRHRVIARARLMAALSSATVIVEAGGRSGSLVVAQRAAELGRRVGAVPGPVTSAASIGPHRLLRDGIASLVADTSDLASLVGPGQVSRERLDMEQVRPPSPAPTRTL